jgi:oxygen-independent coproporphyrinogen-3 oxidase
MGLRLSEGVDMARLEKLGKQAAFDTKACAELASLGYLTLEGSTLKLTPKGRPLLNSILPQLMTKAWQDNAY